MRLADGSPAVCAFVNDDLGRPVLAELAAHGTRLIALRSAGFNNVDLSAAARPRRHRDARARLLAVRGRRVHHRPGPGAQPSPLARVHARARGQLLAPGPARLRPARQDGRHRRHRQDRRHRRGDAPQGLRLPRAGLRPVPERPPAAARGRVRGPRRAAARVGPRQPALPAHRRDAPPHRPAQHRRHEARRDARSTPAAAGSSTPAPSSTGSSPGASATSGSTSTRRRRGTSTRTTRAG